MISVSLVVSMSRPIEIEIENVLCVETNFFKLSRFSRRSRSTFFFSRSRFLKSRFFSRDFDASRFLSRLSRRVKIVEICRDTSRFSRFVETQSRFVEKSRHCWGLKSRRILKSRRENTKIHALLGRDRDKLLRNAENFRSRRISWSRSRLFGLFGRVETKSRFLDLDREILIVETNFLKLSRFSRPSRLTFFRCRDRDLDQDHVETNRDPQA